VKVVEVNQGCQHRFNRLRKTLIAGCSKDLTGERILVLVSVKT
jgi:hypothetical protein